MLLVVTNVFAGTRTEKVRNDKVLVVEESLAAGEVSSVTGDRAAVVVYLGDGSVAATAGKETNGMETVKRGDVVFRPAQAGVLKNAGQGELRLVWIEFLGKGSSETWGNAGLAPNYKVLVENQYVRVYDIRFAAGTSEPQHTHHDRVVICLSGAELEHELPDGRRETSTLKTGEIVWRRGGTHIGHNIGKTDLWVIAIEPK
jgi:quercetin dioxygenase-like cupin family protein